jgi:signal transduction histidine kinase
MIVIGKLENRIVVLLFSFIFISIVGVIDYFTSAELTLTIFYLIPISLHALYKKTTKTSIVLNSLFASFVWTSVVFIDKVYSNNFYAIWNALIVLAFFLITGLLLFYLKEKYKEISELNTHLLQLNEEKNKFIGIAAHDLRSPFSTIYSFSDLLLTDNTTINNTDISRKISIIKDISKSAIVLLENLLNVSAIESGKINIIPQLQNYLNFVKKNIYLSQILADKKEITIKLETKEKEIILNFDEHYLSEVLNNLISNAIKFSYQKSEILIRVTKTEKNNIRTEIIDKGKGIPPEEQFKLFNYFQKTSTTPTGGERSTGLGLAIAKKIILEHGGFIGVNSSIGNGSNFYFELS